jgi:RNA polymerase sigma-70 factor (ECF subfamily)
LSLKHSSNKTDQELLELYYQSQDTEWLGLLLQRYTLLLLGTCMKYLKNETEARDAVQHIFMKVIAELPRYKVDYFKSWIYTIARNYCLMKLRDKNKQTVVLNEQSTIAESEHIDFKELWEKDRQLENMKKALAELQEPQRVCVTLFYLQKQSYQQITASTGYSMLQVKSHIQNGKRNLKNHLERLNPHD